MGKQESNTDCPTCGDSFSTEAGMKGHHAQVHGESIAGFQTECEYCGAEFRIRQSDRLETKNFCDDECQGNWQSENRSGEDSHAYEGKTIEVECEFCGSDVEKNKSQLDENQERYYCGYQCQADWRKENINTGSHDYGETWYSQRRKALRRADHECEDPRCNRTECQNGNSLEVHHIVPFRTFNSSEVANDLDNLLVLCREHHNEIEPKWTLDGRDSTRDRRSARGT